MSNKKFTALFALQFIFFTMSVGAQPSTINNSYKINLAGRWFFNVDSLDAGVTERWFGKKLTGHITLPGSMTTNNKGNDITLNTPWTGQIVDSSYFFKPQYAQYRQPGKIKEFRLGYLAQLHPYSK